MEIQADFTDANAGFYLFPYLPVWAHDRSAYRVSGF
jgi:hypothetical protein